MVQVDKINIRLAQINQYTNSRFSKMSFNSLDRCTKFHRKKQPVFEQIIWLYRWMLCFNLQANEENTIALLHPENKFTIPSPDLCRSVWNIDISHLWLDCFIASASDQIHVNRYFANLHTSMKMVSSSSVLRYQTQIFNKAIRANTYRE